MNASDKIRRLATVHGFQTLPRVPVVEKNEQGFYVTWDNFTLTFTDGCLHNKKNDRRFGQSAGFGYWFSMNHPLNNAVGMNPQECIDSSAIPEIFAIVEMLKAAKMNKIDKLVIVTDSDTVYDAMIFKASIWLNRGWVLPSKQMKFADGFLEIIDAAYGMQIKWVCIPGHAGIFGNVLADQLAFTGSENWRRDQCAPGQFQPRPTHTQGATKDIVDDSYVHLPAIPSRIPKNPSVTLVEYLAQETSQLINHLAFISQK